MNNITKREYMIAVNGAYLFDAPSEASDDRIILEKHFHHACSLFAHEIECLKDRAEPLSTEEKRKFTLSLNALLKTHALLRALS